MKGIFRGRVQSDNLFVVPTTRGICSPEITSLAVVAAAAATIRIEAPRERATYCHVVHGTIWDIALAVCNREIPYKLATAGAFQVLKMKK